MRSLVLFLPLAGCELLLSGGEYVSDTDPAFIEGGSGVCPSGMEPATTAQVTVSRFVQNGLTLLVTYDATLDYSGLAAACVDPLGTSATIQLALDGERYAELSLSGAEAGTVLVGDADAFEIRVVSGDTPTTFAGEDWTTGTLSVNSIGDVFDVGFYGEALDEVSALTVELDFVLAP